jgi:hypothetical protein
MARRGAMTKNPVLRGEARKAAKQEKQAAAEGRPEISPPVTARPPREKPMERLSPGVYRGAEGGLVGAGGKAIQRQPQPQPQPQPPAGGSAPWQPGATSLVGGPSPMVTYPDRRPFNLNDVNRLEQIIFPTNTTGEALPPDKMYRYPTPELSNMPQMPQPSANQGGRYRLSPGVYGTREQAMNQYNQAMERAYQPAAPAGQQSQQQNSNIPAGFYDRRNFWGQPMK